MHSDDEKLIIVEQLLERLGDRKSITLDEVQKILKDAKYADKFTIDDLIDCLSAAGITVVGIHPLKKTEDPLTMYFKDIGDVKILDKDEEIKIAKRLRATLERFQDYVPMTTVSVEHLLRIGKKLELGLISIDDFTITSFRPSDVKPTRHRAEILTTLKRVEILYRKKLVPFIHSAKKASIGQATYWQRKEWYYRQLLDYVKKINPSYRVLEQILPVLTNIKRIHDQFKDNIEETLSLAGITFEQIEELYKTPKTKRRKLAKEMGISDVVAESALKEYRKFKLLEDRISDISLLPPKILFEEIDELRKLRAQYEQDRETLLKSNVRLVVNIAQNYINQGVDYLDLIQEGNQALIRAIERFDPSKGYRVSTYAIWWIRQAMLKAIAEQGQAVRIPTYLAQWARKYSRVVHDLTQRYGREPTKEEIAEELGITVHELSNMLQAIQGQISLDRKLGHEEDSKTLGELLEDTSIQAPDYELRIQQLKEEISKLLSLLDEREAKVISLRFGLEDNYPRTLDEIGRIFGLSRERIRQIEARALRKLRKPFKLRELQQYLKEE